MIENISAADLKLLRDETSIPYILLDVREPQEYAFCNLGGYLIPLAELEVRMAELDRDKTIIVHCRSGHRSQLAISILQQAGFKHLKHFTGGVLGWAKEIDPAFPVY